MHLYLYPFLQTTSELTQYEWLRLGSLGVIGALVKVLHICWIYFVCIYNTMCLISFNGFNGDIYNKKRIQLLKIMSQKSSNVKLNLTMPYMCH